MFAKFDTDGSGALDAAELEQLYNKMGIRISKKEVQEMYG